LIDSLRTPLKEEPTLGPETHIGKPSGAPIQLDFERNHSFGLTFIVLDFDGARYTLTGLQSVDRQPGPAAPKLGFLVQKQQHISSSLRSRIECVELDGPIEDVNLRECAT
jgi:hypothetical protein